VSKIDPVKIEGVHSKDGLLWRGKRYIELWEADQLAQSVGLYCAEQLVRHLLESQLAELKRLEEHIFEGGVDGDMSTSESIECLHEKEKQFGVYDPSVPPPRWTKGENNEKS